MDPQPTPPQTPISPQALLRNENLHRRTRFLALLVCLLFLSILYLAYQNIQLQKQITAFKMIPSSGLSPQITTEPTNSSQKYDIKYPSDWSADKQGNMTKIFTDNANEESLQCGKIGQISITINSTDHFRNNDLWKNLFSKDNFYEPNNPSWKDFFKSGGGGINTDTLSVINIGNQKAIKFTRAWSSVNECWPKTEYHYFLLNPSLDSETLLITQIEYEIPTEYTQANQMKKEADQILSSFKFLPED